MGIENPGHISRNNNFSNVGKGHDRPGRYEKKPDNAQNHYVQTNQVGLEVFSDQNHNVKAKQAQLQKKLAERAVRKDPVPQDPVEKFLALNIIAARFDNPT